MVADLVDALRRDLTAGADAAEAAAMAASCWAQPERRAADTEFFIRKAAGWALRQYSATDPESVRGFVAGRGELLSGLTRREALKHL